MKDSNPHVHKTVVFKTTAITNSANLPNILFLCADERSRTSINGFGDHYSNQLNYICKKGGYLR